MLSIERESEKEMCLRIWDQLECSNETHKKCQTHATLLFIKQPKRLNETK